ncbi:RNA 2',3'-cyclic phosphodiesterase [Komagataeibacter sucrofermentans]|uniref:RNA 2',3'-cyclic phosphodiesterase n=1 Tax=Komagataeibacter sucrofermentans TaxID=1053551 RepID=A0A318QNF5_9PROT|nr:RNA 2',3'-cyclic phosphodiesterase [Komagataeibacter sucrofermentans]PYD81036.1 RNA 2',3'-cyclic phosphodiesterase [Komagataeibacter sucrofermentans]GBQ44537.1 2'-5' RNA ligase [Komagataeibacter sucrofermentans DSM 15973]
MRLFIGLELPLPLTRALAGLRGNLPDVTWSPPESYHLTLHYLGEVTHGHALEDIHHALNAITATPPTLSLTAPGLFEAETHHGLDALWVGCAADAALMHLQKRIRTSMNRLLPGAARSARRFVPHVTMGHMQHPDPLRRQAWLASMPPMPDGEPVGHFTLFQSLRHADGPFYEALEHYPLRG